VLPNLLSRSVMNRKRHARLTVLQRSVEIACSGVTPGGVITGTMWVGQGAQRRDYGVELVAAGLSTVDQRKMVTMVKLQRIL
jgi:hypothetical protein